MVPCAWLVPRLRVKILRLQAGRRPAAAAPRGCSSPHELSLPHGVRNWGDFQGEFCLEWQSAAASSIVGAILGRVLWAGSSTRLNEQEPYQLASGICVVLHTAACSAALLALLATKHLDLSQPHLTAEMQQARRSAQCRHVGGADPVSRGPCSEVCR